MTNLRLTNWLKRPTLAAALLSAVFCGRADAERVCSTTRGILNSQEAPPSAAATLSSAAVPQMPAALVRGGGRGLLTDPDGVQFSHQFAISADVYSDGSARGGAEFVFTGAFAQKYGALPGEDLMILKTEATAGSVKPDGSVELTGPFLETDYSRGDGIVFQEDSRVTGITPWKTVIAPDAKSFTLSWCAFIPPAGTGSFSVQVTAGSINVR